MYGITQPTWVVYELLRQIGVRPQKHCRGPREHDPDPKDFMYATRYAFCKDILTKNRHRLQVDGIAKGRLPGLGRRSMTAEAAGSFLDTAVDPLLPLPASTNYRNQPPGAALVTKEDGGGRAYRSSEMGCGGEMATHPTWDPMSSKEDALDVVEKCTQYPPYGGRFPVPAGGVVGGFSACDRSGVQIGDRHEIGDGLKEKVSPPPSPRPCVKYCRECGQGTTKDDHATCNACGLSSWISRSDKDKADSSCKAAKALTKASQEEEDLKIRGSSIPSHRQVAHDQIKGGDGIFNVANINLENAQEVLLRNGNAKREAKKVAPAMVDGPSPDISKIPPVLDLPSEGRARARWEAEGAQTMESEVGDGLARDFVDSAGARGADPRVQMRDIRRLQADCCSSPEPGSAGEHLAVITDTGSGAREIASGMSSPSVDTRQMTQPAADTHTHTASRPVRPEHPCAITSPAVHELKTPSNDASGSNVEGAAGRGFHDLISSQLSDLRKRQEILKNIVNIIQILRC
jgi:hypothetical protein